MKRAGTLSRRARLVALVGAIAASIAVEVIGAGQLLAAGADGGISGLK